MSLSSELVDVWLLQASFRPQQRRKQMVSMHRLWRSKGCSRAAWLDSAHLTQNVFLGSIRNFGEVANDLAFECFGKVVCRE